MQLYVTYIYIYIHTHTHIYTHIEIYTPTLLGQRGTKPQYLNMMRRLVAGATIYIYIFFLPVCAFVHSWCQYVYLSVCLSGCLLSSFFLAWSCFLCFFPCYVLSDLVSSCVILPVLFVVCVSVNLVLQGDFQNPLNESLSGKNQVNGWPPAASQWKYAKIHEQFTKINGNLRNLTKINENITKINENILEN